MLRKIKNSIIVLFIIFILPLGLFPAEESLQNRLLKNDGDKKIVSGLIYINDVVQQVGGVVSYTSAAEKILKEIKLPAYYVKAQLLGDLINNFCNLYKRLAYKFKGNKVAIFVQKKRIASTKRLIDSGFEEGSLFVGVGWTVNFFSPYSVSGSFETYNPTISYSIQSLSVEYMVKKWLGVNLDIQGFSMESSSIYKNVYDVEGGDSEYFIDGYSEQSGLYLNLMANFHLQLGSFNLFAGLGIAALQYSGFGEPVLAINGELAYDLRGWNLVPTFAIGGYAHIFGKFFLGGRLTLGYLGIAAVTGGIYVKL